MHLLASICKIGQKYTKMSLARKRKYPSVLNSNETKRDVKNLGTKKTSYIKTSYVSVVNTIQLAIVLSFLPCKLAGQKKNIIARGKLFRYLIFIKSLQSNLSTL